MTDNTKLKDIIRKIKALRARAADAASSETEAAKAAQVAEKLLREHDLDLSELDVREDGVGTQAWRDHHATRSAAVQASVRIAKATGCKVWKQSGKIVFLGAPADVELALYYMDLVDAACDSCLRVFKRGADWRAVEAVWGPRKAGSDFRLGVAQRLGQRILEQAEASKPAAVTGVGLVVVKNQLIDQWLAEHSVGFRNSGRSRRVGAGFDHGKTAAEGVGIGTGVGYRTEGQARLGGY